MKRNNIARSLIIFCICAILLYYVYTLFRIGSLLIYIFPVSYTHLRAHETGRNLVCRLLLEKKKKKYKT